MTCSVFNGKTSHKHRRLATSHLFLFSSSRFSLGLSPCSCCLWTVVWWRVSPMGSDIRILGPLLVTLFGEVMGRCIFFFVGSTSGEASLSVYSLISLPVLPLCFLCTTEDDCSQLSVAMFFICSCASPPYWTFILLEP